MIFGTVRHHYCVYYVATGLSWMFLLDYWELGTGKGYGHGSRQVGICLGCNYDRVCSNVTCFILCFCTA